MLRINLAYLRVDSIESRTSQLTTFLGSLAGTLQLIFHLLGTILGVFLATYAYLQGRRNKNHQQNEIEGGVKNPLYGMKSDIIGIDSSDNNKGKVEIEMNYKEGKFGRNKGF